MAKHRKPSSSKNRKSSSPSKRKPSQVCFLDAFFECLCPRSVLMSLCRPKGSSAGRPPRLPLYRLLLATVFHATMVANSLGHNVNLLFGLSLSESALSERRATIGWDVIAKLLDRALRPLASKKRHPHAFFGRWRLLALDATQFNLLNTPAILQSFSKKKTRKGRAGFPKLSISVLLELGLHQPLALAVGRHCETEWPLSLRLLSRLPAGCLLLGDRLYGCAAFAAQALDQCRLRASHFLFRVRLGIKAKVIQVLPDGSRLVQIQVRKRNSSQVLRYIQLREIIATVSRPGFKSHTTRLWTTLLDPTEAPAEQLMRLYSMRWEQELYFRQLKLELNRSNLLHSQSPHTAAQEVAALVMASSLLAHQRAQAADPDHPALQVSFLKTLELIRPLWMIVSLIGDLLTDQQLDLAFRRFMRFIRSHLTPPKRNRSCQRKIRQPVSKWKRLLELTYETGPLTFEIALNNPGIPERH
jgi:hypothetical protein